MQACKTCESCICKNLEYTECHSPCVIPVYSCHLRATLTTPRGPSRKLPWHSPGCLKAWARAGCGGLLRVWAPTSPTMLLGPQNRLIQGGFLVVLQGRNELTLFWTGLCLVLRMNILGSFPFMTWSSYSAGSSGVQESASFVFVGGG